MKKIKYILLVVLLPFLLDSCEKVIDFDPGEIESHVVLISRPTNDSTVNVYLNYSSFFLETSQNTNINDASLLLEVNGVPYAGVYGGPSNYGLSCYSFGVIPQIGDSLKITVNVPGYDKIITSQTVIPARPQVDIVDYVIDTVSLYDYYGHENHIRVRVKLKSANNDEYFSIKVYQAYRVDVNDTTVTQWDTVDLSQVYFSVDDPLINTSDIETALDMDDGSFYGDELLVSSELFQNGEHEFSLEFADWYESGYTLSYANKPLIIEVRSLTKDLYLYTRTTGQQSELDEFFGEPVQVHCNIDGGIGIFGGYSMMKKRAVNPRYADFYIEHDNYKK